MNQAPLPATTVCSRQFLLLLESEAPAAEFERLVQQARAAGCSDAELASLETAKQAALRIRDELAQRRRREAELAALFETATDLAGLHDLDSVLRALVRRARQLLGTDVAYLTLHDPGRRDTYMRVTSGSVSPLFQQLRLGLGEGLGGLVAQHAAAYATADYFADERFRHTRVIDRGVVEEGLVAILGTPLQLGRSVIGVLFAADRRPRAFSPAEVAVLASMAAHAAVAIDAANLLEETRTAMDELNAANKLIKEHSAAVDRAAQAHRRFTELVLAGGKAADVACAVAEVLHRDVIILDADGATVAASGQDLPAAGDAVTAALAHAQAGDRAVRAGDLWIMPAAAGPEHLGTVVLHAGPDLPESDQLILEWAGTVTALLLLLRRSVAEAEQRVRGELLSDLLGGRRQDDDALRDRAQRLGADLDRRQVVVVAENTGRGRARARSAAAHLAATRHGLAAEHESCTVLLLPGTVPAAVTRDVASSLTSAVGHPVTAAGAQTAGGPAGIAGAYREARRCLDALLSLGRHGDTATPAELGFLGLLLSDRKDVPAFLESVIGPLLRYDASKGSDLVGTLEAYYAAGGNLTRTKELLHIHVNTVTQRLDRVSRLIGDDWRSGAQALETQLAIRLYRAGAQDWSSWPGHGPDGTRTT